MAKILRTVPDSERPHVGDLPNNDNAYEREEKGFELDTEDYLFMDYVINEISVDGKLPFKIPAKSLPRIIIDCALWFYRECDEATTEVWYGVKYSDLKPDKSAPNQKYNKAVKLPDQIEAIMQVYPISSALVGMATRFAREPMYYAAAVNTLNNFSTSYANAYRQFNREYAYEESVVRMFEYAAAKTMFRKGVRFDYNANTHIFRCLSENNKDLVLSCFQRIELKYLYNDINFRRYVVATAMENLERILNSFDFKLPGDVSINIEKIQQLGSERKEKIEETIKSESSGADLFIVK